jgi:sigma-E factor negative regulatory protein RseB
MHVATRLASSAVSVVTAAGSRHGRVRHAMTAAMTAAMAMALSMLTLGVAVAADAPGIPTAEAIALLNRIQHAAQTRNYVGTFVHQQGSQVQSSRVTHMVDRAGEHEKLELMDGQAREFIRHNDDVRCFIPDSKLVLIEKRARSDTFPALLTSAPLDIDRYYRLSIEGLERIAGRNAQRLVLDARDRLRYGYRLWFDQDTYLLLKAQTINENGQSIEQVAFTDVTIDGAIDRSRIKPSAVSTEGWRTETNRMVPVDLAQAGWTVTLPVAGFRKVMEVRRAFGGREDIGQMVYSDGLAAISIFIEPAEPHDTAQGEASKGPINVVTERHGDFWLTIVGDAPVASVRDMAKQVVFKSTK